MSRPRILLADDHTLVLQAFKHLLEGEFDIVGTAANGRALVATALQLKPDVVVLDLLMPQLSGVDAAREIKKLMPRTKIVVLTMNEDSDVAAVALRQWASGYLLKKSAAGELVKAVREALKGQCYVTPSIANRLTQEFIRDPATERIKHLTLRQREVIQLLAEGRTMKEAADVLQVTTRTIAFHKYRIMEEFGLKTNADIVRFAIREHILPQQPNKD